MPSGTFIQPLRWHTVSIIQPLRWHTVSMRRELLEQDYHIETIITKPSDLGFGCISRLRIYLLLIHKKYGRFVGSPQDLYSRITDKLQGNTAMTIDAAFWESDVSKLRSELLDSMTKTRISNLDATGGDAVTSAVNTDWSSFLTDWEKKCLSTYQSMWVDRHESLANAVFVLNQNPEFHKSWTSIGSNGQVALPTLPLCLKWCSFYFPVEFLSGEPVGNQNENKKFSNRYDLIQ